jgi:hypothetical protein
MIPKVDSEKNNNYKKYNGGSVLKEDLRPCCGPELNHVVDRLNRSSTSFHFLNLYFFDVTVEPIKP